MDHTGVQPHSATSISEETVTPTGTVVQSTTDEAPLKGVKTRVAHPTFVAMPNPATFTPDTRPTPPTSNHSTSESFSSALATFDSSYGRASPSSSNPAMTIETGLSVLVVDDDSLTRTLMKRILTRLGCHVTTAENGEVALELILGSSAGQCMTPSSDASGNLGPILEQEQSEGNCEESRFAVVFLDNQMPVLSGLKTVEKLRELGRTDFVVGVTGVYNMLLP